MIEIEYETQPIEDYKFDGFKISEILKNDDVKYDKIVKLVQNILKKKIEISYEKDNMMFLYEIYY